MFTRVHFRNHRTHLRELSQECDNWRLARAARQNEVPKRIGLQCWMLACIGRRLERLGQRLQEEYEWQSRLIAEASQAVTPSEAVDKT